MEGEGLFATGFQSPRWTGTIAPRHPRLTPATIFLQSGRWFFMLHGYALGMGVVLMGG
jgi:hypothetical protein